ncbi:MAG: S41 family peptidase [Chitinophagaceae bacterium]
MKTFFKNTVGGTLIAFSLMVACSKKDVPTTTTDSTDTTTTLSTSQQLVDSIFLYAKQLYLWYDQLPDSATFLPLQYASGSGTDSAKGTAEIFALSRYAINSSTGKSYEYYDNDGDTSETKYSFLESSDADLNGGSEGVKSYVTLLGWGNDLGLAYPVFVDDSIFAFRLFYENGPAWNAGLRRGNCYVTAVNGKKFAYSSSSDITYLNSALNASSITLTYFDTTSTTHTVTLTQTRYSSNPIFADTVLTSGSHTIGYIALLNFADPDVVSSNLKSAFSSFSSDGITDIIVDLRYNGGGYVETSQQMANLIAPSSLSGKTMFSENYNALMQAGNATILKQIPQDDDPSKSYYDYTWAASDLTYDFSSSAGVGLSVSNVCFIVSDGTASASELLINNLSPYMNVQLIGTTLTSSSNKPATTTTYGKPVGFFAIPIGSYDVYLSEFESRNSNDEAVSYSGMTCNVTDWDDLTHDFGDHREDAIAQAISYITNGSYLTTSRYIGSKSSTSSSSSNVLQTYMSLNKGLSGSSSSSVAGFQALKTFHNVSTPIQKGMIENFKTIRRNQ